MKLPVNYDEIDWKERRLVREEYVKKQNGLCCYCNRPLDGEPAPKIAIKPIKPQLYPEGFFKHPVHLHHNYVTGMTIGAVHAHCNAVLWEYEGE